MSENSHGATLQSDGDSSVVTVGVVSSWAFGPRDSHQRRPFGMEALEDHGIRLVWTDERPASIGGWRARWWSGLERAGVPLFQGWQVNRMRPDVVLAMFESEGHGLAAIRALMPRRWRRRPLVIIGCWLSDQVATASRSKRAAYRWLYRGADRIVVLSANQVPELCRLLGHPASDVIAVPFGVPVRALAAAGDEESADGVDVVAVGRDRARDWTTLIEAVRGTGWRVVIVTRPSQIPAGVDLPAEVEMRSVVDRSTYLALLSEAKVAAVISHHRLYPTGQTVLMEAMALGRPVVVTDSPALADYVDADRDAVVVPRGQPGPLRDALERLLADPGERRRRGDAGRQRVLASGDETQMWSAVASVIRDVVNRPG